MVLAGLPGTGKSTLARAVSARLGGTVLDKDRVREALFPGAMTDYTREQDDLCVRAMLEAAAYMTEKLRTAFIFIDGRTFSNHDQIDEVVQVAERAGARWRILHVTCSDAVAEERLSRRDPENPARESRCGAVPAGEGSASSRLRIRNSMWTRRRVWRVVSRRCANI